MGGSDLEDIIVPHVKEGEGGFYFELDGEPGEPDPHFGIRVCGVYFPDKKKKGFLLLFGDINDPYIINGKVVGGKKFKNVVKNQGAFKILLRALHSNTQYPDFAVLVPRRTDLVEAPTAKDGMTIAGRDLLSKSSSSLDALSEEAVRDIGYQVLFRGERDALQRLQGVNPEGEILIPPLLHHSNLPVPHMVMPFIEGRTVQDLLLSSRLSYDDRLRMAERLSHAVALAHSRNVVHGDPKLTNVIDGPLGLTLLDFGNGQIIEPGEWIPSTKPGAYKLWAPEQIGEDAHQCQKTDVHQLAVSLTELLSDHHTSGYHLRVLAKAELQSHKYPTLKQTLLDLSQRGMHDVSRVPRQVRSIIKAALNTDAEKRPTAQEVREYFRRRTVKQRNSSSGEKRAVKEIAQEISGISETYQKDPVSASKTCTSLEGRIKGLQDRHARRSLAIELENVKNRIEVECRQERYGPLLIHERDSLAEPVRRYMKFVDRWEGSDEKQRSRLLREAETQLVDTVVAMFEEEAYKSAKDILQKEVKRLFMNKKKVKRRVANRLRDLGVEWRKNNKDYAKAREILEIIIDNRQLFGSMSQQTKSITYCQLGDAFTSKGDYSKAEECYHEAFELAETLGMEARVKQRLGVIEAFQGDIGEGKKLLQEAYEYFEKSLKKKSREPGKKASSGMAWTNYWEGVVHTIAAQTYLEKEELNEERRLKMWKRNLVKARNSFQKASDGFKGVTLVARKKKEAKQKYSDRIRRRSEDARWAQYQILKLDIALGEGLDTIGERMNDIATQGSIPEEWYFHRLNLASAHYQNGRFNSALQDARDALKQFRGANYARRENFRQALIFLARAKSLFRDLNEQLGRDIPEQQECIEGMMKIEKDPQVGKERYQQFAWESQLSA